MSDKRGFVLVGGPRDGERIALPSGRTRFVVLKPREPTPLLWREPNNTPHAVDVIEYCPVRGIPHVLAPSGMPPELVVDMLVEKYR